MLTVISSGTQAHFAERLYPGKAAVQKNVAHAARGRTARGRTGKGRTDRAGTDKGRAVQGQGEQHVGAAAQRRRPDFRNS